MAQLKDCLVHWKKKLERGVDEAKALDIIRKLNKVPITVQLLQETGIGKVVKLLGKQDGLVGEQGSILLKKWKEVVASASRTDSSPNKKVSSKKDSKNKSPLLSSNNHSKRPVEEEYIKEEKHLLEHASKKAKYSSDYSSASNKYTMHKPTVKSSNEYDPESNGYNEHQNTSQKYSLLYVPDNLYDPCINDKSCPSSPIEYKPTPIHKIKSDSHSQSRTGVKEKHTSESSRKSEKYHNGIKSNSSTSFGKNESDSDEKPRNCTTVKVSEKSHKKSLEKPSHFSEPVENSNSMVSRTSKISPENSKVKNIKSVKVKKLKLPEAEEFTASEATFEDCLGLNDIVTVKKKKNAAKLVKVKRAVADTTSSVEKTSLKVKDDGLKTSKSSKSSSQSLKSSSSKSSSHSSKSSSSHKEKSKSKSVTKDSKEKHKKLPEELQVKPTPLKLDETEITFTLPEINANYRPLPRLEYDMPKKKGFSNEDAIMFTTSKKDRTAVYSGRKNYFLPEVPTLLEACTRVLIDNVTCIEQTGGVPYFLLKPVLVRCSPQMLCRLEDFNPYLLEDTDELWQQHCARDFRNRKPDEFESWRDMYLRIMDEQEEKLKKLTSNIRGSMSKSNPVRKAKLAYVDSYVKPPRDVARKQAKFGTGLPVSHSVKPDATSPKPVHRNISITPVSSERTSSSSSVVQKKPKPAPLMAKTLKAIKRGFRR